MIKIPPDSREFIELLNSKQIKYLIVGGYAVAYHGHPRMTGDIDFFVEISKENAVRLEMVLGEFGFGSLGLAASDFLEAGSIIQLGFPPNRIDILTSLSGVSFDEAWPRRVEAEVQNLSMSFVGKDDLLANKAATGRLKDLADIAALTPPGDLKE